MTLRKQAFENIVGKGEMLLTICRRKTKYYQKVLIIFNPLPEDKF